MDNYRRRLLVYFSTQSSSNSTIIDPTIQDVPNGVYIEDTDGILYSNSVWPSSGVTPNSVVVITNECKVRLALTEVWNQLNESGLPIHSVGSIAVPEYIDPFPFEYDDNEDPILTDIICDYNGSSNTKNIMKFQPSTSYAAGYCARFIFPDGSTKGCLPAAGQMLAIFQNWTEVNNCLLTCGGIIMNADSYDYWTSTPTTWYSNLSFVRIHKNRNGYSIDRVSSLTAELIVRPVAEYKPFAKDLSMVSGVMNTANCYMVHKAGMYKIPLVYGNAIKNGLDNQVAYKPGGTAASRFCTNFVNHNNDPITAPWITKSGTGVNGGMGITVDSAQLIWQDVYGLTTNYSIEDDYLTFKVPSFVEGNAVIAVKSGSTIVWSWHIWVTSEDYSNLTVVSTGSHNYSVTPCNLGWVPISENKKYGYCPYYQWGRKDPFVPSDGLSNIDHAVLVGSGVDRKGWAYENNSSVTIATNIQNPWKHYYVTGIQGPVNTAYYNMWDAQNANTNNVTNATKKTIYDPCPTGFCVPTGNLYYFMGDNKSYTTWDERNTGRTWTKDGASVFFPVSGLRYSLYGSLTDVGSVGYYLSATPGGGNSTSTAMFSLRIASNGWGWYSTYLRASGDVIRPVAEE